MQTLSSTHSCLEKAGLGWNREINLLAYIRNSKGYVTHAMSAMSSLPCPTHVCSSVTSLLHLHAWNFLLITPCKGCQSLWVHSLSCYFSYIDFMYLLNIAQLWVQGGWRQWGVFVICGHWSAAPQLCDVLLGLIECIAAGMLSALWLC